MSASNKKKLRCEQNAAKLTEKQLAEQKEAKQLKIYTTIFVAVLALLLVVAIGFGVTNTVRNSGILERNTTALTLNGQEINSEEMSYYFVDCVQNYANQYGSYISLFGLDPTQPLNSQVMDETSGRTWADYFVEMAQEQAVSVTALVNAAKEAGHTLTQEEQDYVDQTVDTMSMYATMSGYPNLKQYLKAVYGSAASEKGFRAYQENTMLAQSYSNAYATSLTYTGDEIAAADAEAPESFSSYTYNTYYLSVSSFLTGGTTDENGNTTYSDEEKSAAAAAALETAQALTGESITSLDALNGAISSLAINADSETAVTSTACEDYLYSSVNSLLADWVCDPARQEGDLTYIESSSTTTGEDGNEVKTVNGYYVVYYVSTNDNTYPLANVRHILVGYEGGTTDANGNTTYSDEEKAAAREKAEELLEQWKSGDATEDSFAALATEHSTDTGSTANGGLYENVYPGQMVAEFEDWCFGGRKSGDTGIVETTYGAHVMYYCGDSDTTYRSYMIENQLANADYNQWFSDITAAVRETMVVGKNTYLPLDMILQRQ